MPSIISTLMGDNTSKGLNNEIIANDMIAGAKAAATAYLTASLESATPEVKSLFFNNVTQITQSHQAMIELAVKKGWYKPYKSPEEQLQETFKYSQTFTGTNA